MQMPISSIAESDLSVATAKNIKGKSSHPMDYLLKSIVISVPKAGEIVDGMFVKRDGPRAFVDLGPYGTGVVYVSEPSSSKVKIKNFHPGDQLSTKVVTLENEEGFIELSLAAVGQDVVWREAEELMNSKKSLNLKITDANKGGLVLEWSGIQGFLPASQLRFGHYPRVEGGDQEKIYEELRKLIGEMLAVTVIATDQKENKLIFSEKGTESEEMKNIVAKYQAGGDIEGTVAGVVDFGIFIKLEESLEGLAHISELDWGLVDDPRQLFKVGDKVRAKIISIKDGKFSLSVKALKPNPWDAAKEKYKKGDIVEAVVIRFNRYGALASVEEGIAGLIHISEFKDEKTMKEKLALGKTYPFQITIFEPAERRMALSYLGEEKKPETKPAESPSAEAKAENNKEPESQVGTNN